MVIESETKPMSSDPATSLVSELGAYPYLAQVLGGAWVREHETIPPEADSHRIARWLRSDTAASMLATIETVIKDIRQANVPRAAAHLRPLRSNPEAFLETATELYFLHWLINHSFPFDLPNAGPDFHIDLGGGSPFALEATTPRKTDWQDELLDRLKWVAVRFQYWGELIYSVERLPDLDGAMRDRIVERALASLTRAKNRPAGRHHVTQRYAKFHMQINWRDDAHVGMSSRTTGTASLRNAFELIAAAAATKDRQLPKGVATGLLLGVSQLPTESLVLIDRFRNASSTALAEINRDIEDYWRLVPNQVKHICLYELSLDRTIPFRTTWIENPACPYESPPHFQAFRDAFTYPQLS